MYLALRHGHPAPIELVIWDLVKETGWTLDYIDSLPLARFHDWIQITDGRFKAKEGK